MKQSNETRKLLSSRDWTLRAAKHLEDGARAAMKSKSQENRESGLSGWHFRETLKLAEEMRREAGE